MRRAALSLTVLATALASARAAQGGVAPITEWYNSTIAGKSTYYGNYGGGGACNLDQAGGLAVPPEIKNIAFTVAMNNQQFKMGGCGMCIELTGDGSGSGSNPVKGTYTVFVNNLCPECHWGHLDFALNGDGLWNIKWRAVPCDVGGSNIRYEFKGSNTYWMKISPQATRYPVSLVEIFYNGAWVSGAPSSDQMYVFEAKGGAQFKFPMKIRTTSIFGQVVLDTLPALQSYKGTSQFPLLRQGQTHTPTTSSSSSSSTSSTPSSSASRPTTTTTNNNSNNNNNNNNNTPQRPSTPTGTTTRPNSPSTTTPTLPGSGSSSSSTGINSITGSIGGGGVSGLPTSGTNGLSGVFSGIGNSGASNIATSALSQGNIGSGAVPSLSQGGASGVNIPGGIASSVSGALSGGGMGVPSLSSISGGGIGGLGSFPLLASAGEDDQDQQQQQQDDEDELQSQEIEHRYNQQQHEGSISNSSNSSSSNSNNKNSSSSSSSSQPSGGRRLRMRGRAARQ